MKIGLKTSFKVSFSKCPYYWHHMFFLATALFAIMTLIGIVNLSYADEDSDTQTIGITIPLIALIDVEDISPSFTFTAPTNAGEGFEDLDPAVDNEPSLAISSNNSVATLTAILSSTLEGMAVQVKAKNCGTGSNSIKTLNASTPKTLCAPGVLVTTAASLEVNINPTLIGSMIPYGTHSTSITYTLTEN